MRLFHTSGSPFARAVRVALRETGLLPRVEEVETTLRDPASSLLPLNPVGRVPTLVLPDGTALTETALILPFLDTLGGAHPLLPPGDLAARAGFGRILGMLDGMAAWNRELRRPPEERSPAVVALETARTNRVADALEAEVAAGGWSLDAPPDAARITLGCLLGYAERRHRAWAWREGRPALSAWVRPDRRAPFLRRHGAAHQRHLTGCRPAPDLAPDPEADACPCSRASAFPIPPSSTARRCNCPAARASPSGPS